MIWVLILGEDMAFKMKIVRAVVMNGGIAEPGDTVEVEKDDARLLFRLSKAVPATAKVAVALGLNASTATDPAVDGAETA